MTLNVKRLVSRQRFVKYISFKSLEFQSVCLNAFQRNDFAEQDEQHLKEFSVFVSSLRVHYMGGEYYTLTFKKQSNLSVTDKHSRLIFKQCTVISKIHGTLCYSALLIPPI